MEGLDRAAASAVAVSNGRGMRKSIRIIVYNPGPLLLYIYISVSHCLSLFLSLLVVCVENFAATAAAAAAVEASTLLCALLSASAARSLGRFTADCTSALPPTTHPNVPMCTLYTVQ